MVRDWSGWYVSLLVDSKRKSSCFYDITISNIHFYQSFLSFCCFLRFSAIPNSFFKLLFCFFLMCLTAPSFSYFFFLFFYFVFSSCWRFEGVRNKMYYFYYYNNRKSIFDFSVLMRNNVIKTGNFKKSLFLRNTYVIKRRIFFLVNAIHHRINLLSKYS